MSQRRIFSGIQPTGNLHIGNYLGAIKRWTEGQDDGVNIFCIVDMHAITLEHDPAMLREKTLDMAALLLASGIDPEKSLLFVQSQNLDHANLAWILNCNVSMGQMKRMTQYKEKSDKKDFVSVGLFDYPVLMAADILLYNTTEVPIGDDQKQHVELTRDVAERFNSRFGETFVLPEPVIAKTGARIMSLIDPTKKMSKSDENDNSRINMMDEERVIINKFRGAVTDSGNEIRFDPQNKPGISNLLEIYSRFSNEAVEEVEKRFVDASYGEFKEQVAGKVCAVLCSPGGIQAKYQEYRLDENRLREILHKGAQRAREISGKKLDDVYEKVGFVKYAG